MTANVDLELMKRVHTQIGDIRVRYHYKTTQAATILAQQWNRPDGKFSFRTFNFLNVHAKAGESTEPTGAQRKANTGLFKRCKDYNGGAVVSYIERVEPYDDW